MPPRTAAARSLVKLTTTDGAKVEVECVRSRSAFPTSPATRPTELGAGRRPVRRPGDPATRRQEQPGRGAAHGRHAAQPGRQGASSAKKPTERHAGANLVTRVLNLTGKDIVTADLRRRAPARTARPKTIAAKGRLIANGVLAVTDRDYEKRSRRSCTSARSCSCKVTDADLDASDERDIADGRDHDRARREGNGRARRNAGPQRRLHRLAAAQGRRQADAGQPRSGRAGRSRATSATT